MMALAQPKGPNPTVVTDLKEGDLVDLSVAVEFLIGIGSIPEHEAEEERMRVEYELAIVDSVHMEPCYEPDHEYLAVLCTDQGNYALPIDMTLWAIPVDVVDVTASDARES